MLLASSINEKPVLVREDARPLEVEIIDAYRIRDRVGRIDAAAVSQADPSHGSRGPDCRVHGGIGKRHGEDLFHLGFGIRGGAASHVPLLVATRHGEGKEAQCRGHAHRQYQHGK